MKKNGFKFRMVNKKRPDRNRSFIFKIQYPMKNQYMCQQIIVHMYSKQGQFTCKHREREVLGKYFLIPATKIGWDRFIYTKHQASYSSRQRNYSTVTRLFSFVIDRNDA
jgi:hypothetical protein